ncbi:hypothetical protein [Nostocoides vanveenii]|jgi:hypothetical protein|uniref:Uncharacterized protein n=1 Tax=Nostocoides vanveenii TaxID=330835 RepID=A0ABP4WD97_9MICO
MPIPAPAPIVTAADGPDPPVVAAGAASALGGATEPAPDKGVELLAAPDVLDVVTVPLVLLDLPAPDGVVAADAVVGVDAGVDVEVAGPADPGFVVDEGGAVAGLVVVAGADGAVAGGAIPGARPAPKASPIAVPGAGSSEAAPELA